MAASQTYTARGKQDGAVLTCGDYVRQQCHREVSDEFWTSAGREDGVICPRDMEQSLGGECSGDCQCMNGVQRETQIWNIDTYRDRQQGGGRALPGRPIAASRLHRYDMSPNPTHCMLACTGQQEIAGALTMNPSPMNVITASMTGCTLREGSFTGW